MHLELLAIIILCSQFTKLCEVHLDLLAIIILFSQYIKLESSLRVVSGRVDALFA